MRKINILSFGTLLLFTSLTYAQLPEVVIGPGLGSGRTAYHQKFERTLSSDTAYVLTGLYYVDSTFSLKIQPGTVVFRRHRFGTDYQQRREDFCPGEQKQPCCFHEQQGTRFTPAGGLGGILVLAKRR